MYKSKLTFEKVYEEMLGKWPRGKDLESFYKTELTNLGNAEDAHDASIAEKAVKKAKNEAKKEEEGIQFQFLSPAVNLTLIHPSHHGHIAH